MLAWLGCVGLAAASNGCAVDVGELVVRPCARRAGVGGREAGVGKGALGRCGSETPERLRGAFRGAPGTYSDVDINRALALAATAGQAELRRVYAAAVARGANSTGCTAEEERGYGTPRLVTLALMRVVGPGAQRSPAGHDRRGRGGRAGRARGQRRVRRRAAARAIGRSRCTAVRSATRLTRGSSGRCCTRAPSSTGRRPGEDEGLPVALDEARAATAALARASEATASDRMLAA